MNLAIGHAFNMDEIFENFDTSKLKLTSNESQELFNDRHLKTGCKRIFRDCVNVILNDIIDNNVTFNLPTGKNKACIHVKRTSGDQFKKAVQNGKWNDIDFLASMFSGNQLVLEMGYREKPIYVAGELKQKLIDNTNNGKQYC